MTTLDRDLERTDEQEDRDALEYEDKLYDEMRLADEQTNCL